MVSGRLARLSRKMRLWVFALLPAMLLAPPAAAGDAAISVHQAEIRATAGAMATGGYARIVNSGHADVTLVRVDADFAAKAEIPRCSPRWCDENAATRGWPCHSRTWRGVDEAGRQSSDVYGLTGSMKLGDAAHYLHFDDGHTVLVMAKVKKPADIGSAARDHLQRA